MPPGERRKKIKESIDGVSAVLVELNNKYKPLLADAQRQIGAKRDSGDLEVDLLGMQKELYEQLQRTTSVEENAYKTKRFFHSKRNELFPRKRTLTDFSLPPAKRKRLGLPLCRREDTESLE